MTKDEAQRRRWTFYEAVNIPWRLMAAFPDVLIHEYEEEVDTKTVWKIVQEDLPILKQVLAKILPPLEQVERELAGEADEA